jgi:two-component system nitrogen regulation response regulator GlnG
VAGEHPAAAEPDAAARDREPGLAQLRLDPRLASDLGAVARPRRSEPIPVLVLVLSGPGSVPRRKPSEVTESELVEALRACAWDLKAAADRLRIPRPSIYDLIDKNPNIRTAGDLGADEITRCFHDCAGDLDAMVARLEVSKRALSRRIKELGLVGRAPGA